MIRRLLSVATDPTRMRAQFMAEREFRRFKHSVAPFFRAPLMDADAPTRRALVLSVGMLDALPVELTLLKGLEMAGYTPVVLANRNGQLRRYYTAAGVRSILWWEDFLAAPDQLAAEQLLASVRRFDDLLSIRQGPTRVGKYAASTSFRRLRVGSLDMSAPTARACVREQLAKSIVYAAASERIIADTRPALALSMDPGYTPRGELYDACLAARIETITWNAAHKSNTLMLKRYGSRNDDVHPASVSDQFWDRLRHEPWTDERRRAIHQELHGAYASGDWYSEVGTQFNTRLLAATEVRQRLGLSDARKTVVVFPHIFWDATFFWGTDLFASYEEWFIETVRAAISNTNVNWIIKIHPAHLVKNARDGFHGQCSELVVIQREFGTVPDHIRIIPPDSDINTFSLFDVMDCCVTVRGTVGLEAATFGIPTLTAGTGRYDRRGFTIDSATRPEFLERLADIQRIPRLSPEQRTLAEQYAYGLFLRRPFPLTTAALEYQKDSKASARTRINIRSVHELHEAPDLRAFSEWVSSGLEDFDAALIDGRRAFLAQ